MSGFMSATARIADQALVDGAYLMTATAETVLAIAPHGARHTAFTGSLLTAIRDGVADGPDPLDMDTLLHVVQRDLRARRLPLPQGRSRNAGHRIAIARNRAAGRPPAVDAEAEHVALLTLPPRSYTNRLNALRDVAGPDADLPNLLADPVIPDDDLTRAVRGFLYIARHGRGLGRIDIRATGEDWLMPYDRDRDYEDFRDELQRRLGDVDVPHPWADWLSTYGSSRPLEAFVQPAPPGTGRTGKRIVWPICVRIGAIASARVVTHPPVA
ncbi:hypothetical protein KZZ52_32420 [Dactylosporangium sp. AC04546]|uniref:hypothetical protein n=1 Tax=Dactylosporangium sp. AC04546 TaxID=2862460 RepID=UPI001EE0BAEC|nr:hypothetical protein [Dactylosporangium sp. AC04546]WVK78697.1 hypothetical protein KZZ52_32420 [Dactylosporangium sp. AC04546]